MTTTDTIHGLSRDRSGHLYAHVRRLGGQRLQVRQYQGAWELWSVTEGAWLDRWHGRRYATEAAAAEALARWAAPVSA